MNYFYQCDEMDVLRLAARIPPRPPHSDTYAFATTASDRFFPACILATRQENQKNPFESFSLRKMIPDLSLKDTRVHFWVGTVFKPEYVA